MEEARAAEAEDRMDYQKMETRRGNEVEGLTT